MTGKEREFLATYDPAAFDRPSVTVDLVLMSALDGALQALLMRRAQPRHGEVGASGRVRPPG